MLTAMFMPQIYFNGIAMKKSTMQEMPSTSMIQRK